MAEHSPTATPEATPVNFAKRIRNFATALSPEEVAAIRAALLKHKVIFFRDQDISQEDHVRFGRYFHPQ